MPSPQGIEYPEGTTFRRARQLLRGIALQSSECHTEDWIQKDGWLSGASQRRKSATPSAQARTAGAESLSWEREEAEN